MPIAEAVATIALTPFSSSIFTAGILKELPSA